MNSLDFIIRMFEIYYFQMLTKPDKSRNINPIELLIYIDNIFGVKGFLWIKNVYFVEKMLMKKQKNM